MSLFRIYADGTVVYEDDFDLYDNDTQYTDDYEEYDVPDPIIEHIADGY